MLLQLPWTAVVVDCFGFRPPFFPLVLFSLFSFFFIFSFLSCFLRFRLHFLLHFFSDFLDFFNFLNSMCSIGVSLLQSDSLISHILITIIIILLISIERVCPPGLLLLLPSRAKHRNRSWRHKISELRSSQYRNTLTGERKYTPQRAKRHKIKMKRNTYSEMS